MVARSEVVVVVVIVRVIVCEMVEGGRGLGVVDERVVVECLVTKTVRVLADTTISDGMMCMAVVFAVLVTVSVRVGVGGGAGIKQSHAAVATVRGMEPSSLGEPG